MGVVLRGLSVVHCFGYVSLVGVGVGVGSVPWIIQWCPIRLASRYSHRSRMSPVRESCIIIISSQMYIRNAAAVFGLCGRLRYAFAAASAIAFGATPACPGVHRNIAYPLCCCRRWNCRRIADIRLRLSPLRCACRRYARSIAMSADLQSDSTRHRHAVLFSVAVSAQFLRYAYIA